MKYKKLGVSGLYVSELVLGTMTFGDGTDEQESGEIFHRAIEAGVNLIDTADLYAGGHTEEILRPLIAPIRHDILVATKGYFPIDDNPNHRGSSRLHLTQAIEDSLRRMGTDYIDIYYLHRFDENVPLEESLHTMDDAIRAGKVRYLGFSNYAAWQIEKALGVQERLHLNRAIVLQPQYNLIKRQAESEIFPCAKAEGLGVMTYSPLAAGLLTGKYLNSSEGRLATNYKYQMRFSEREIPRYVEDFVGIAKDMVINPAALAIAWVMANPTVTAPIIGARKLSHWEAALEATEVKMTPELYTRIARCTPEPPNATDRLEEKSGDAFSFVR
ncbi:MAG: aldo/keto reductase [Proteobacteria bacterium]|nr:aldo/keto reductase [Pseudomonadota bacterium]